MEGGKITLSDQIEEVGKQIRDFERRAPYLIDNGKMFAETVERKIARLKAAYATLEWMALNETWIKREAELRLAEDRARREREFELAAAENDDGVKAARAAFPDAEVSLRELETEG